MGLNILLQESRHCAFEEKMGTQFNEIKQESKNRSEETEQPDF